MIRRWMCSRGWHRLQVVAGPVYYACRHCGAPVQPRTQRPERRELSGVADYWSRVP